MCAADVVKTRVYLSWEWRSRLLFNICCPSSVRWNHPASLMAPRFSREDNFTYYCSTGMLGVIKHIPYTPLVKLICSLFSFQACRKSRLDFGFPGPEPSFSHLFHSFFFLHPAASLQAVRVSQEASSWSRTRVPTEVVPPGSGPPEPRDGDGLPHSAQPPGPE